MQDNKTLLVYELEYNRVLNKQNIFLGFFGAFALTIFSFGEIPLIIRIFLIAVIIISALILLTRSSREAEDIINKIKKL